MELAKEKNIRRMQVWLDAWNNVAQAANCYCIKSPSEWGEVAHSIGDLVACRNEDREKCVNFRPREDLFEPKEEE